DLDDVVPIEPAAFAYRDDEVLSPQKVFAGQARGGRLGLRVGKWLVLRRRPAPHVLDRRRQKWGRDTPHVTQQEERGECGGQPDGEEHGPEQPVASGEPVRA